MPADRLSALDIAFLCIDDPSTPMHMGAVGVFATRRCPGGERIASLVAERARALPRLRLRVRTELTGGAHWYSDPDFDPACHVGTHDLGADGAVPDGALRADPLTQHAARWLSTPLDTRAPLWNAQVVTGLPEGGFALLVKLHHALCDGAGAAELALGLLDDTTAPRAVAPPACSRDGATEPGPDSGVAPLLRTWWDGTRSTVERVVGTAAESAHIAGSLLRAVRPYPLSPTLTTDSARRGLGLVRLDLDDVRRVRKAHGGTTNDVVLAVLAGALREWLRHRNRGADPRELRALVPVSTRRRRGAEAGGNALSAYLCELPVGTEDPLERLHAVSRDMDGHKRAGTRRGAGALPVLAERIPGAVHRLATRTVAHTAPALFDTVVTAVPLPGVPLSLAGAPLREAYPVVPLAPHQSVGFAVSTYRGGVHVGLHLGGDAVDDAGALADAVTKSMAALRQLCP
ncbi:wax ester/triacylglycerol synthase family O-acyltransferase [Saccharomonospora piscinae]|uniref:wax ester/triacylglycerol synthase family O-acyltransferase n=1 Tax=Saccharomonospora piscinae TaxID=687388 RepID=UPI0011068689|nr:wax ester/triacylglycerol synthase family O-acyltransferase [Saccharomonospora piscinae]TLW92183.1 wax ester/triacylglycerol synthase family O-acyltransferase [Saccharomonospora piscinae]